MGFSSAGLHMPGAANLANHASSMDRNSGSATSLPTLMPSTRCPPHQTNPRRRARSSSENFPSGFRCRANRLATFSNWSGRRFTACSASDLSALATSAGARWSGRSRKNRWMTCRCSPSTSPSRQNFRSLRQHGWHGLPGQRGARRQLLGVADAAACLARADPQHVGQGDRDRRQPGNCSNRATTAWPTATWRRRAISRRSNTANRCGGASTSKSSARDSTAASRASSASSIELMFETLRRTPDKNRLSTNRSNSPRQSAYAPAPVTWLVNPA